MRIATVVGARPQFVKAATVSRAVRVHHHEILIHTGQHYDFGMSQVFFDELQLPAADYNLGVGSASHGVQTARMIEKIEAILLSERPDLVLVYGDTNSTLAAALAAVKMHIPVAHVEAGLRSFNMRMPEEVNRRLTDHISSVLFTPTDLATAHLAREGIVRGVYQVGDVMVDVLLEQLGSARTHSRILRDLGLRPGGYVLATIHRAENTDEPGRLKAILQALHSAGVPVVFPMHPRTRRCAVDQGLESLLANTSDLQCIEPVGYLDMLLLEQNARRILTDSGGIQKEAYLLGVPCLTVRDETEWQETVASGWNRLVTAEVQAILVALEQEVIPQNRPPCYGDGQAAQRIAGVLAGLH
ncbi:MAG: UDP-N-acetylglucosamine 2-epimerase (non-hydrolyzing) [Gemmatimonadaceae bacterium]|nr:UDP-N-acetylglucosamine 2-epimerase (non-hydrolyzing) [Gloeobacterales cyanobacterium ES-bin-141]